MRGERVFWLKGRFTARSSLILYIYYSTLFAKSQIFLPIPRNADRPDIFPLTRKVSNRRMLSRRVPPSYCHAFVPSGRVSRSISALGRYPSYWRSSFCAREEEAVDFKSLDRRHVPLFVRHLFLFSIYIILHFPEKVKCFVASSYVVGLARLLGPICDSVCAVERFLIPSLIFSINIIPYFSRKVKSFLVTPRARP